MLLNVTRDWRGSCRSTAWTSSGSSGSGSSDAPESHSEVCPHGAYSNNMWLLKGKNVTVFIISAVMSVKHYGTCLNSGPSDDYSLCGPLMIMPTHGRKVSAALLLRWLKNWGTILMISSASSILSEREIQFQTLIHIFASFPQAIPLQITAQV